jgi:peptidyl-prolyl cis-trans isomerase B (cyclophilin B)
MKPRHRYAAFCLFLIVSSALAAAEPASFADATREPYSPVPENSINGKSVQEMKAKVQELWDGIVFEKAGQKQEYLVTLETEKGDIQVELWPDVAPNHARSFIALAQAGFFDGLIFHRVIPGFVIQGGCPKGNGTGGPGYCLKPEFNARPHERGVLSMARATPTDSAGSQFFVCVAAARFLDNKYTAFGKVTSGMDAVDKIVKADRDAKDRPLQPVKITKATVAMKGE